jgi:hypothetical protein
MHGTQPVGMDTVKKYNMYKGVSALQQRLDKQKHQIRKNFCPGKKGKERFLQKCHNSITVKGFILHFL